MFGEVDKKYKNEINKTETELKDLKNGKITFWIMPEYINLIKIITKQLKRL